ncbi:MAG TPA: hypothetical protein RMG48_09235 [Myxococcales bacterium LLY-WYZ-16_1]|nr:hypothetical protein [Myxococcales bacterium LLY-WYZ-16_1]
MAGPPDPSANRFLLEVEASIIQANRRIISEKVGTVTRQRFEQLAQKVAQLRADYLAAAFDHDWDPTRPAETAISDKRRQYEESVAAFEALERAVRRGYVELR